jgi:hypothetical protein
MEDISVKEGRWDEVSSSDCERRCRKERSIEKGEEEGGERIRYKGVMRNRKSVSAQQPLASSSPSPS